MTSAHDIDLHQFLTDRQTDASPDLLRSLLSTFIDALMGAESDSLCGAGFGERSENRTNSRNGYRHRDFAPPSTSCREVPPPAPGLSTWRSRSCGPARTFRTGCCSRKRAERALTSVVATGGASLHEVLGGVPARRLDPTDAKLVDSLGITSLSKSQVSVMAKDLDTQSGRTGGW